MDELTRLGGMWKATRDTDEAGIIWRRADRYITALEDVLSGRDEKELTVIKVANENEKELRKELAAARECVRGNLERLDEMGLGIVSVDKEDFESDQGELKTLRNAAKKMCGRCLRKSVQTAGCSPECPMYPWYPHKGGE